MAVLKLRCVNISRLIMTSLFQVLHMFLKFLKLSESELKDDFICLSIHHIQKLRWGTGYQLLAGKVLSLVKDDRHSLSKDYAQFGIVSGSLIQLVCSLVEQSDMENMGRQDKFVKLVNVIPRLVTFLQEQQPKGLSQYYKHKILMVMIRLKPHMQQNCSHIICLKITPKSLSVWASSRINLSCSLVVYSWLAVEMIVDCNVHKSQTGFRDLHKLLDSVSSRDIVLYFLQLYMEEVMYYSLFSYSFWMLHLFRWQCKQKIYHILPPSGNKDNMETKWTCKLIGAKLFSIIFDQVHTCQLPFAVFIGAYDWCRSAGMLLLIIQCAKRRYKNSVRTLEDLHQKDLFPYNPKPLLKSLARFEESSAETIILCLVTPAISVVQYLIRET